MTVVGLGIDTVDIDRFRLAATRTPRMLERVFTEGERATARRRPDPTQRFAARFAAKEATWKAMGVGLWSVGYHDVEVVRLPSGQPTLRITGKAAELAAQLGIVDWKISMTHTDTVAEAIVIALGA